MNLQDVLGNKLIVYPIVAIVSYFVFSKLWLIAMLLVVLDTFNLLNMYNDNFTLSAKDYVHIALSVPLYLSIISFAMPTWFAAIPAVCFAIKCTSKFHDSFDEKFQNNRYDAPTY